jgi:hypothetical protein
MAAGYTETVRGDRADWFAIQRKTEPLTGVSRRT